MPAKQIASDYSRRSAPKGFFTSTYETITSSENAAVVRSIAVFGAAVAFLASPLADFLQTPA